MAGFIIDLICKHKKAMIEFLQKVFLRRKLKKYRLMLETGNSIRALYLLKKRFGWDWLKKLGKKIAK